MTINRSDPMKLGMTVRFAIYSFAALGILASLTGCASYRVGNDSLYRPDIVTVYVPIIQSESFRPFLGERLTEAVVKEIELKTPYKVVQGYNADSVLSGRIVNDSKYAIIENVNDEPRDLEVELFVELNWSNRRGEPILEPQLIPVENRIVEIGQAVHFIPEAGQSMATAQQDAIDRLAEQIVARMEVPW